MLDGPPPTCREPVCLFSGSHSVRQPIGDALNRLVGPDDLVAVMTPEMSVAGLTFDRSPRSINDLLARHWDWGKRAKVTAGK